MATEKTTASVPELPSLPSVAGAEVIVRQETPFLPKVAFAMISLASLAGAVFTGTNAGLVGFALFARWFSLWGLGLTGGFAVWRLFYMRAEDADASQRAVDALNATALARAQSVSRVLAAIAMLGTVGLFSTGYLVAQPLLMSIMVTLQIILTAGLLLGVRDQRGAVVVLVATAGLIAAWAWVDTAGILDSALVRFAHLTAFSLWLGGAVWNIWVAMLAGREHPTFDAVIAGAHQLDRFRVVVRVALPTIIVTGLVMASVYRFLPLQWWVNFPGILIPSKVLAIIALVVVFISCPLFRHCSPVQGVCNLEDLDDVDSAVNT